MQEALAAGYHGRRRTDEGDLSSVKTLRKALAILDAFAVAERPLSVADVAVRAGITRPTAHRLIQTLIAEGYLAQDPGDNRIAPGYSVLQLAAGLLDRSQLRLESLPHLENLARNCGERVSIGILHRRQVLYLAGVEKPSLPTIYSRFGKTVPAYCSAIGKAILANLTEPELRAYFDAERFVKFTETTIADEAGLRAELAEVRRNGFALDRGENDPAISCVGSAILVRGKPVAGIAAFGRSLEPLLPHTSEVQHTAEVISHLLSRGA